MIDLALVQMPVCDGNPDVNLETAERMIRDNDGADLYLLPELFTTGYAWDSWNAAGDLFPKTISRMEELARQMNAAISGSVIARDKAGLRNRMFAAFPDRRPSLFYDKIHLFGLMREDVLLQPGEAAAVFEYRGHRFGMAICYDLRFPIMFQRMAPSVDVFLVSSEWPEPRCDILHLLARARAAENQCYLALSNRPGASSDGTVFCGRSMLVGPDGSCLTPSTCDSGVLRQRASAKAVEAARLAVHVLRDRHAGLDDV